MTFDREPDLDNANVGMLNSLLFCYEFRAKPQEY